MLQRVQCTKTMFRVK